MKTISIALLIALLTPTPNNALQLSGHHRDLRDEVPESLVAISLDSGLETQQMQYFVNLNQSLLKTKQSLADGDFDKARRSALKMSKSIKEMVQSLHRSDDKQVSPQSTAQRQTYQSNTADQKRACYVKAMHSINDIEQQIQQIMHIIPTISDINKKTGLISSISPVLEKALNELIIQLETTQKGANRAGKLPLARGHVERELKEIAGVPAGLPLERERQMKSDGDGGFEAGNDDFRPDNAATASREEDDDSTLDSAKNEHNNRNTSDRDEEREDDSRNEEDDGQQLPPLRSHHIGSPPHKRSAHVDTSGTRGRPQGASSHRQKSAHDTKITINMDGNESDDENENLHKTKSKKRDRGQPSDFQRKHS